MSFEPFTEGGPRQVGAPYALVSEPPESPLPCWEDEFKIAHLIYAHPDDELLFAGGLMLARPGWNWYLTRVVDAGPEREGEHDRSVMLLREHGVNICDTRRIGFADGLWDNDDRRDLLEALKLSAPMECDITLTHGARGEYGHHHHIHLHHAVHALFDNVWDFLNPCWRVKQLAKTRVREVPTDDLKRAIFDEAYAATAVGLRRDAPWLTDQQLTGKPEYFTQGVIGL